MHYSVRSRGKVQSPPEYSRRVTSRSARSIPIIVAAATGTTVTELSRRNLINGACVASVVQYLPDQTTKRSMKRSIRQKSADETVSIQQRNSIGTNMVRPFIATMRQRLAEERRSLGKKHKNKSRDLNDNLTEDPCNLSADKLEVSSGKILLIRGSVVVLYSRNLYYNKSAEKQTKFWDGKTRCLFCEFFC
jgi:hypothetical protein